MGPIMGAVVEDVVMPALRLLTVESGVSFVQSWVSSVLTLQSTATFALLYHRAQMHSSSKMHMTDECSLLIGVSCKLHMLPPAKYLAVMTVRPRQPLRRIVRQRSMLETRERS